MRRPLGGGSDLARVGEGRLQVGGVTILLLDLRAVEATSVSLATCVARESGGRDLRKLALPCVVPPMLGALARV